MLGIKECVFHTSKEDTEGGINKPITAGCWTNDKWSSIHLLALLTWGPAFYL